MNECFYDEAYKNPNHFFNVEIPFILFDMYMDRDNLSAYCHLLRLSKQDNISSIDFKIIRKKLGITQPRFEAILNTLSSPGFYFDFPLIKIIKVNDNIKIFVNDLTIENRDWCLKNIEDSTNG